MTIINGTAHWASITSPNTTFEPTWQIDVSLDKANKAKVVADGLKVKNKGDDRGDFVSLKRRTHRKDGKDNQAPTLIDKKKRPLNVLVGNGSIVNVKYAVFEYNNQFGSGIGADLKAVQVLELVEYGDDEDFDDLSDDDAGDDDDFDDIPLAAE